MEATLSWCLDVERATAGVHRGLLIITLKSGDWAQTANANPWDLPAKFPDTTASSCSIHDRTHVLAET